MKIALLLSSRETDGIYVLGVTHAKILSNAGHQVSLFVLNKNDLVSGTNPFELQVLRQRLGFWPGNLPWVYIFELLPPPLHLPLLSQCLKALSGYDFLITYDNPTSWLGYYAKKRYGIKYIFFNEGVPFLPASRSILTFIRRRLAEKVIRNTYTQADLIAMESITVRDTFKQTFKVPAEATGILTDLSLFNPNSKVKSVREKYNLGYEPLILFVDNITPVKRVDMLIEAYHQVRETIPDTRLMILGKYVSDSYQKYITSKCDSSVIQVGYIPHSQLPGYYAAATVFATCAEWEEGCSHTILEAQACGTPAVAFNLTPHKEVISDGETGILVDKEQGANGFANALIRILSNPQLLNTMGKKAADNIAAQSKAGRQNILNLPGRLSRTQAGKIPRSGH